MYITFVEYSDDGTLITDNKCVFHGDVTMTMKKQSFTAKRTIGGRKRYSYSNPYSEYNIRVDFMDSEMFTKLENIFYNGHRVYITTSNGDEYIASFTSDTLSLNKEYYNKDKSMVYRFGTIMMED